MNTMENEDPTTMLEAARMVKVLREYGWDDHAICNLIIYVATGDEEYSVRKSMGNQKEV